MNNSASDTDVTLQIRGEGVSLLAPGSAPQRPIAAAPPLGVTDGSLDDPTRAAKLDGSQTTLAPHSAAWYRFDYAGDSFSNHPIRTITLKDANQNANLKFEVYSPEILNAWFDNRPIGHGTMAPVVCNFGTLSATGGCYSNNLTWSGAFGATGP